MFRPTRIPFPPFIKKTDEDRIQLFPDYHERWGHLKFEVTEKIDGQSATYFVIQNPERGLFKPRWIFGVCSRNFQLVKPDDSSYWSVAKKYDLKNKLIDLCDGGSTGIILQGEIIGNKIQGNKYNTDGYKFFMFNALLYNNGNSKAYNEIEMSMLAYRLGINRVPTLYAYQSLPDSIEKMVQLSSGVSKIAGVPREGIVVRNYDNNISFKVINPEFLLKYND
jgi:RNA ligase (TIGR02306 family)